MELIDKAAVVAEMEKRVQEAEIIVRDVRLTLPVELISSDWNLEPIDACVDMIVKLHELNLL